MQLEKLKSTLADKPGHWLITGGAGFIGSHLVENLLELDQEVTCLDNFSAGQTDQSRIGAGIAHGKAGHAVSAGRG